MGGSKFPLFLVDHAWVGFVSLASSGRGRGIMTMPAVDLVHVGGLKRADPVAGLDLVDPDLITGNTEVTCGRLVSTSLRQA